MGSSTEHCKGDKIQTFYLQSFGVYTYLPKYPTMSANIKNAIL
jgi:hypothetical protein